MVLWITSVVHAKAVSWWSATCKITKSVKKVMWCQWPNSGSKSCHYRRSGRGTIADLAGRTWGKSCHIPPSSSAGRNRPCSNLQFQLITDININRSWLTTYLYQQKLLTVSAIFASADHLLLHALWRTEVGTLLAERTTNRGGHAVFRVNATLTFQEYVSI